MCTYIAIVWRVVGCRREVDVTPLKVSQSSPRLYAIYLSNQRWLSWLNLVRISGLRAEKGEGSDKSLNHTHTPHLSLNLAKSQTLNLILGLHKCKTGGPSFSLHSHYYVGIRIRIGGNDLNSGDLNYSRKICQLSMR